MSSPTFLHDDDPAARRQALNPRRSFVVRAPAGSGKTELLIQRYLALLAQVKRPEAIVAITFTKKAAGEMRERIMKSLRAAHAAEAVQSPYEQVTRELARQALERDREQKWNLLEHPGRLRVQTMDSLWMSIAAEMPWLSRLGEMPRIQEDARVMYAEAARRTLLQPSAELEEPLEILLRHLDNNAAQAQELIQTMLAKREQWIELTFHSDDEDRAMLEEALRLTIKSQLVLVDRMIPESVHQTWLKHARIMRFADLSQWPDTHAGARDAWVALTQVVLTKKDWRKKVDKTLNYLPKSPEKDDILRFINQLQQQAGLLEALQALRDLPAHCYSEEQWSVLRAMLLVLQHATARLWLIFSERGEIDFCELTMAASKALGDFSQPTDLAFKMDARVEHLLIDEFQDTSRAQFDLVKKLTADWQDGDGRTLFLVGDPAQSIYRFRQAEVGLFLLAEEQGLGAFHLEPLQLSVNYRSIPAIVERVNQLCAQAFPASDDRDIGAVAYRASEVAALEPRAKTQLNLFDTLNQTSPTLSPAGSITWDIFEDQSTRQNKSTLAAEQEAARVVEYVRQAPAGSIAILVRARTHLQQIVSALKAAELSYAAVEVDPLDERPTARDLLSLTFAMLHRADRISWLAILRAPWCGLGLADLEALVRGNLKRTIWECLQVEGALSDDGRARALRLRDVLEEAFAEQGRWPLRRWVERAWMKLGGPAALSDDGNDALSDAAAFFNLLEQEQEGVGLRDLQQFQARVKALYAKPAEAASTEKQLRVMTIHQAKGLQFDTVIVPGLGNRTRSEDQTLVLFHEWTEQGKTLRLMAPINETAGEQDALYRYLKSVESRKSDHERKRLMYVAMTRARKRLHLLGAAPRSRSGEIRPHSTSMLADVWPALSPEEREIRANTAPRLERNRTYAPRRLPSAWVLPPLPAPVMQRPPHTAEPHEPTFEWVSDRLRRAGTVVHAFLQRMAPGAPALPAEAEVHVALRHAGVSAHDLDSTGKRVIQALRKTLAGERGRWILAAHQNVRTEYALTAMVDGEVVRGLIDRTFADENGVRWVIDFKTSTHEGAGLEEFLDEEQRRYRDQMDRYARILQSLGQEVRLGLYFPLLDAWREWSAGTAQHGSNISY